MRIFLTGVKKGSAGCFLQVDAVSHALEFADEAVAAVVVVVDAAHEPVTAQIGVGGAVVQQMPADGQDRVRHGQGGFLLTDPSCESPELCGQVAVFLPLCCPGALDERFAQPPVPATGGAGLAFTVADVVSRT